MEHADREAMAERLLRAGALHAEPGAECPLRWDGETALEDRELRRELTEALARLVREQRGQVKLSSRRGSRSFSSSSSGKRERPTHQARIRAAGIRGSRGSPDGCRKGA